MKQPLTLAHIKPRLLDHWGTPPGLNFIYAHLNRVIKEPDLNVMNITGPGLAANAYLEGTYSEVYPNIAPDEDGMKRLFKQFSFPGGIPPATSRRRRPARFTKAASWVIRCHTLSARRSIILSCWSRASSAMEKRKPARSPRTGLDLPNAST